ncbi:peptidoglycan-binding protein [Demequina sp.]|uniref:peptidoglycan-binding protein n=1 Tax=Demequina sp. TaxID=2050685 RepID=UPI0025C45BA6|nr:peptidoglycan-binding protein [Demequina sp.]
MSHPKRMAAKVAVFAISALAMLAVGWFGATLFVSPDQRAADAAAPSASVLTAPVIREDLVQTTSGGARVQVARTDDIDIPLAVGSGVVTASPLSPGDSVGECSEALEIDGRPLVVIVGQFPFYRDLALGDTGPDVSQLQRALRRCGSTIRVDGDYGPATAGAVKVLYSRLGYELQGDGTPATSEFVVAPAAPTVVEVVPAIGATLTADDHLTLASGPLIVLAEAPDSVANADFAAVDVTVTFDGDNRAATIQSLRSPATDDAFAVMEVKLVGGDVPAAWKGVAGTATYATQLVASDALVVPTAAVVSQGLDSQLVYRADGNGGFVAIAVRELGSLNGRTAVMPIDGQLDEGDIVIVGGQ